MAERNSGSRAGLPARLPAKRRLPAQRRLLPYILISPLVVFIGALSFYPTVATAVQAFFRVTPLDPPARFDGLQNFRDLFANSAIRASWVNTAVYMATGVVLSVVLGIAIAVALKQRFRLRGIVLALVVLPWALPAVVEAVIWNWIYDPNFGVMNSALHSLHLIGSYSVWLGVNRWLTIVLIEIVQVWQITPLSVLIILAALQAVPPGLYEAARVDGAGAWQAFRRISLPMIRPAVAVAAVQALVLSLNVFDQVYVLNGNAPLGSSVMLQTYLTTFQNLNFGQGYALSLLVTAATAVLSLASLALLYRRTEPA
jgi:multiple sugar transport system permease protein